MDAFNDELTFWRVETSGRKVYFIPKFIDKASALEYVSESIGEGVLVSAGDSWMDFGILDLAGAKIVPLHGAVRGCVDRSRTTLITGPSAAWEILKYVEGLL